MNRRARGLRAEGPLHAEQCRARATVTMIETRSLDELEAAAARVRRAPAPVALAGGDGSHGAGVSALARAFGPEPLPPIALLPGGTVNTVARGWGMHGDVVAYTRRLLDRIVTGAAARTRRPTLLVEAGPAPGLLRVPEARVGFIFGAGLVSRFFELYDARGAPGLPGAAAIAARVFAGSFVGGAMATRVLTPAPCALAVDGATAPLDRLSLLCASVVDDVGLGLRLMYRACESFDRFHVVATALGPHALGPQMPRVLLGLPLRGARVDTLAASLDLRFPVGTGAYVVDGDLVRGDRASVRPGPVLEVLEP